MVAAERDVRERTRRALRKAGEGARRAQKAAVEARVMCLCCRVPDNGRIERTFAKVLLGFCGLYALLETIA